MISDGLLDIAVQYKHNTASHKDETILTGLYNYKTTEEDKMAVLLGKNGDESRTVAVNNDIITSLNVKKIDTHTYSMLLGLFAGKVKEEAESESESETSEAAETTGKRTVGTVIGDYLNVRMTPDIEGELAGVLENGMKINVLDETEDGWLHITYGEDDAQIEGYVKAEYVFVEEIDEEDDELEAGTEDKAEVTELESELETEMDAEMETEGEPVIFEAIAGETSVHVEAPADAFPEGTTMQVTPVDQEEVIDAIRSTVEKDDVKVTTVTAVDITFYDADGAEIQPLKPIKVTFGTTAVTESQTEEAAASEEVSTAASESTSVVHVNDAGEANVVDFTKDENNENIVIETQEFSVYAIVGTETLTTNYITAEGDTYLVTVTYGPDAKIPQGSRLEVKEVRPEEDDYAAYKADAAAALNASEQEMNYIKLLDITIMNGTEKVEIAAPVDVEIKLLDKIVIETEKEAENPAENNRTDRDEIRVVHFGDNAQEVEAGNKGETVSFSADSFSVYAIVSTTVNADFLTADGKTLKVTVVFDKDEPLPANAVLEVKELEEQEDEKLWGDRYQRLSNVLYANYGKSKTG